MKVVNFYGGPGTGKSTVAASVFAELKWRGYNVELVTEFAKDLVWEKRFHTLEDQIYIFGKQFHKIHRLIDQVEFVITDSPLLLSLYYGSALSKEFKDLVYSEYKKLDNIDIFLKREKEYNPKGRMQTLEEAKEIDKNLINLLSKYSNSYSFAAGTKETIPQIVNYILEN